MPPNCDSGHEAFHLLARRVDPTGDGREKGRAIVIDHRLQLEIDLAALCPDRRASAKTNLCARQGVIRIAPRSAYGSAALPDTCDARQRLLETRKAVGTAM
ncbi:hypothetical protein X740_28435 [Mesorhizobium sp. LNHC221B00]|nr:hypothetical protein X740_28435 [Mesorhizobium sp. LNHC221B00]